MPQMAIYLRIKLPLPDLPKLVTNSHIAPDDAHSRRKIASFSMTAKTRILFGGFSEVCSFVGWAKAFPKQILTVSTLDRRLPICY